MSAELPRPIQSYVRRFVARGRRIAVARALGVGLLAACCWAVLACAADRVLRLPAGVRVFLLLAAGALLLAAVLRPAARLLSRRVDWVRAAEAVEAASPAFGERLSTVVSQSLEPSGYRGSPEMLERLAGEVAEQAARERPGRSSRWGGALRPWAALAGLVGAVALAAWLVPSLGSGVLLRRFATPLAAVPPVTTTQIRVEPRGVTLLRGEALAVRAEAVNLGEGPPEIATSADGRTWSRLPMVAVSDSEFVFNFPAVEEDLRYYVAGGDARTEEYRVTVLRKPALAELRVRYDYPAYTGRAPLAATVNDGQVEALAGTRLGLTLVSTEPLREAAFVVGGAKPEKLALSATSDPRVFRLELTARRVVADLVMTSAQGQSHRVERALSARVQPDREPIARLLQPAGDLRLAPRDLLEVQYQFMDDYGLTGAWVVVQVNTQAATQIALPLSGDARSQQGRYVLDLAALKVKVGDVVAVSAGAQDGAGRRVVRDTRNVLVSPRSVDAATHLFIAELRQALEHAGALAREVEEGASAAEAARRPGGDPAPQRLKVTRALGAGADAALLLHQALLRACPRCPSTAAGDALAGAVDKARVALWSVERLAALDAEGSREPAVAQGLKDLAQAVRELVAGVKVLADGQQASAVLADRGNLAPLRQAPPTERLSEAIRRAEQDLAEAVEAMGLKPAEANLQDRLRRRAAAAEQAVRAARVIDFAPAARQWGEAVAAKQPIAPPLAERLASASIAEALRADGDPVRARDLQLASRAAARLGSAPADHIDSVALALAQFPEAVDAVQAEHRLNRTAQAGSAAAGGRRPVLDSAAEARRRFAEWATRRFEWPATAPATGAPAGGDELALEATAGMARGDLASARELDRRLADSPDLLRELGRMVDAAELVGRASGDQRELAEKTASARTEQDAAELEASQRRLAEKIPGPAAPAPAAMDSRRQGLAAVERSQEQLALLPQRLTAALASAEALREANGMAEQARRDAAAAPAASKPMAQRAAELAASAAREAQKRLAADAAHLAPAVAEQMVKELRPFLPEATEASAAVGERLGPALASLQQSLRADGPSDLETAAQAVRGALELVQAQLGVAQKRLLEKDPAVAARFYAHEAAQALALRPPDFRGARKHQESALQALNRAWLEQLRAAGYARLGLSPGFRPLLRPAGAEAGAPPGRSPQGIMEMVPGVREWGFLPPRTPDAAAGPAAESDPAGYQEALRLYFEALNKVGAADAPRPPPR